MELKATIDDADFQKAMTAFPSIAKKELRLALYSTSHSVVLQAQAEHRFKTKGGNLEKSIQSRMSPEDELAAEVFFNEGIATYGKYQHDGTGVYGPNGKEYPITPKSRKALYFVTGGQKAFSKGHTIKGIKPDPFITNAAKVKEPLFNKNISNAVNATITAAGLKS